ncbi:MAG: DUF1579 family protein [Planctomycetes bacterium]|nr:DUF1579 family protein [Planctomycetota bacterium]
MRKWLPLLILLPLVALSAQNPPLPDNSATMKKLDWLVGAWSGGGEMKDVGKYTDDMAFEWTLNGNFLKVVQTVRNEQGVLWHSTGLLGWDVQKKQFAWFQFGFDGTIGWTRTVDEKVDGVLVMEGTLTGGGPFSSFRSTLKRTGDDTMNETVEFKTEKGLEPFTCTDFKKVEKVEAGKVESADAGHLKKMDWMVGTWLGGGEMPGQGKYEDEFRLEWTHSGNFIRNDYWMRVDGKVVWHDTGLIGFDPEKKVYVGVNFGFDGTIGWGEGPASEDGTSFTWEGETVGPSENIKFRATVRKVDADTMGMKIEKKEGEGWVPYMPEQTRNRKKE